VSGSSAYSAEHVHLGILYGTGPHVRLTCTVDGDGAVIAVHNDGRAGGVRPQDIVGALANESNLSGRDIGAIQIHERHALVEVPEHAADDVLRSLRGSTTLKGRRANVRRDRDFAGAGRGRS
jgi:hypothetical protein